MNHRWEIETEDNLGEPIVAWRCGICGETLVPSQSCPGAPQLKLVWKIRKDGRLNAECACGTTLAGFNSAKREEAEDRHFAGAEEARRRGDDVPPCGPVS